MKTKKKVTFLQLVKLALVDKKIFFLGFLGLVGGNIANLTIPALIRYFINSDYNYYLFKAPMITALFLIGLFIFQGLFSYLRSYYFAILGSKTVANLRKELFENLIAKDISFFDKNHTGDLVSRVNSDCAKIQDAVSFRLSVVFRHGIQVIFGLILMSFLSTKLAISAAIFIPVLVLLGSFFIKKLRKHSKEIQASLGLASTIAEETFSQKAVVTVHNKESYETERFAKAAWNIFHITKKRAKISAVFSSLVSFALYTFLICLCLYGFSLVSNSQLAYGDLTAFILYGMIVGVSFPLLVNNYIEIVQALGALERVYEFFGVSQEEKPSEQLELNFGFVRFQDVSFSYPNRDDVPVLKNIGFDMQSGTTTALVGPSGSGKSTIAKLLLGFYEPNKGVIKLGQTNLKSLNKTELYEQVAYVPQEPILFSSSIKENLLYGKSNATMGELEKVCNQANILDFIYSLPDGFETVCGERGTQLSSGQKQRIAIARAILRNPRILVLDEATASLDSENENLIQEALSRLMSARTVLVIAHRLSTIKNANQVLVVNNGEIVQNGNHETLISETGLYAELVAHQELDLSNAESYSELKKANKNS